MSEVTLNCTKSLVVASAKGNRLVHLCVNEYLSAFSTFEHVYTKISRQWRTNVNLK